MRPEIRKIQELMEAADYVTDAPVATSVHLALTLRKPLLIEGHAGVGKTEVAKVMARVLGTNLIRLQCYEGLDASTALYEWNYQKQLLHIKLQETSNRPVDEKEHEIFSEPFLLRRPLLQAISQKDRAPVLLVDEVDRCVTARTLVTTTTGVKRAEAVMPGDEVVSFDPDSFRLTRSQVRRVVPRRTRTIMRILVGGRLLEVTSEHKFVRYSAIGPEVVRATDLRVGDRLPLHTRRQPPLASEPRFDLPDSIVLLRERGRRRLDSAYRASSMTDEQLAVVSGASPSHLRNVLQPRPCRASIRAGALGKLSAQLGLENPVDAPALARGPGVRQTVGFYELLGYIVADGCVTRDRLCISAKDRANLEIYAANFHEAFGVRPRITRGPHRNYELTYRSLPLGRFLARVLGDGIVGSSARTIPEFVFSLPEDKRAAFVRGYFDGEGWVGDHQVSATSSSPYLLVGVQHVLSSLGIESGISTCARAVGFGQGPYFTLTISDVGAFADGVGFRSSAKRSRLALARRPRCSRSETLPRPVVVAALERVKEQRVLRGVDSYQTVYDILSGPIGAAVSSIRRIAEAFSLWELRELLGRGVVLGEVTSVEERPTDEAVFDLVLDGQPYFVANEVVTHNCDEEFEAFLLEVFSEWQITIPEIGPIAATHPPHVILTSNRNRELSDALRRRCLYLWIDYPSFEKEVRIVERKVPGVNARVAREITRFMESLRAVRLSKVPGVAETLDWAQALTKLHADHLDGELVAETLGCVLKDADDMKRFRAEIASAGIGKFIPLEG